ncbi:hypothetical protein GSI_01422 [Ganoderma sinense ZZ0214-1]|uniref:Arrestin-like N-terminal domain-containing protein n=1 Tax=Ganoderma sinense ZZ0214-1 TaxID=1077348 RepID=A0A2G8SW29_9APHY|nr:hypothetical protein GSI_01422 [Ganoderma sinense ZZ0214-1]
MKFITTGAPSCFTLHIPPAVYVSGSTLEGEVELNLRELNQDEVEEVHVELRGSSYTWMSRGTVTLQETVDLANDDVCVWTRNGPYPLPGSDTVRVPFCFVIPERIPPSFSYWTIFQGTHVRYSVAAVGVRKGALTINKRHLIPLPILPRDEAGAAVKDAYASYGWKMFAAEDKIRKGLWGEYSKVHVELALPNIQSLPLFSDIPYVITVTTTTAPLSHSKAHEHTGEKEIFPPVPHDPHEIEFELHRLVKFSAKIMPGLASEDVATFLGGKSEKRPQVQVAVDFPAPQWVSSSSDGGEKSRTGSWVQRGTYRSTFRLNCPPTFTVDNIDASYTLTVKVPFPGIGNSVKLEIPVVITSGITKPLARDPSSASSEPPLLDLPPSYWDANNQANNPGKA